MNRSLLALLLSLPLAAGCIYPDEPCLDTPNAGQADQPAPLRNPFTGDCQSFGGGGGGGGGSTCGEYEATPAPGLDRAPIPDWGSCTGYCESLSESDCLTNDICRGTYTTVCGGDVPCELSERNFNECWSLSTSDPFSETGCSTYDADECARHNDCIAVHAPAFNGGAGDFYHCADEVELPNPGSCTGEVSCRQLPPECPAGTVPGILDECWSGFCIPVDQCDSLPTCSGQAEDSCVARADCNPIYQGVNCVCQDDVCVCESWDFESCENHTAPL